MRTMLTGQEILVGWYGQVALIAQYFFFFLLKNKPDSGCLDSLSS